MSQLTDIIRAEIALRGPISFARFMELALYCPEYGFYEKESDTIGRHGDFYTSVSVGALFGQLLAFQFADWLAEIDADKLQLVEVGAHDGTLANDILAWLAAHRPQIYRRLEYVIVEPSLRRAERQKTRLKDFLGRVRWRQDDFANNQEQFSGVIFANELLDAMPVRRIGWNSAARRWFEWAVTNDGDRFVWKRCAADLDPADVPSLPDRFLEVLPDGFTTELGPAARAWWRAAAQRLRQGWLWTADYGMKGEDFFSPERFQGTLRAYRRHQVSGDVLEEPGAQDITAHVNFTEVQHAGEAMGLETIHFESQSRFLAPIVERFWQEFAADGTVATRRNREVQTLMHPEHLGRAFRVLVQRRQPLAERTDASVGQIA